MDENQKLAKIRFLSGVMLGWLMRRGIEPHIPILDREHQTKGYFTRADFSFDATANAFTCPGGKMLLNKGLMREDGTMPYRASTRDCRGCALKTRCTKAASRIVTRNLYEAEREHVRGLRETPRYKRTARLRKKVEMCFAHLKRNLNFRRLRLRGLSGAKDRTVARRVSVRERGRMPPGPTPGGKIGEPPRDRGRVKT